MRDQLENEVLQKIPDAVLNGTSDSTKRLPNTSSISFAGINGEAILAKLNDAGVCISTGSACNAEMRIASPVLQAMNVPYLTAMGAIRFSLGRYNTETEVSKVLEILPQIIEDLKAVSL
jgi:cysteine desulfurase